MAKNRPTVSLFVPAYNAARTLPQCLRSISLLSVKPDEVIVADDGSKDETPRIARRAGARLISHHKNRGVAATRNTAIRAATGDLIAALDSDLVVPRDWLAKMLRNFEGRRRIAGCCGRVIEKYTSTIADRWRSVHMKLGFGMRRSYTPRWLYCGISLIRRDAILDVGLFDERCRSAYEDVDLSNRLRAAGHTLLYDPTAVAWHLKQSKPGDVVRGFWSYWAAKNEMQGLYQSLAAAARLMIERQMGIAAYRIRQDLRHKRDELLPLDAIIPLAFCVRDLDDMVRLGNLTAELAHGIQMELAQCCQAIWDDCLPHKHTPKPTALESMVRLAFAGGRLPDGQGVKLVRAARSYVATFEEAFGDLLVNLPPAARERISENVPALIKEARL